MFLFIIRMVQKHRISTNIGKDQVVKVELKQDFDLLEILSLKFTQKDVYTSLCADYGVVCGRITVNNGLGVPNAKISIFIPLSEEDENDPVISALYPYKSSTSDVNNNGYRYNLLPARKQHGGHEPTGTFPDQSDVLNREEILEVYEKYYKYTVKTNTSGDFMIWGVPLGQQTLHVDVDLSDVGCFSLRPYDFIKQGLGEDAFKNTYTFKSSSDLSTLPQIITLDKTIDVYPFWGNEDLCEIGITRTDFDLSENGVKIEPKAFLIGGTYTDTGKNALNKNCQPRIKMGRKCDLTTKTGTIEAIRFTSQKDINNRPVLEVYDLQQDIPDDGGFVMELPMNTEFLYTNEFGENEITNDPNKGIPTAACYRLRFSLDDSGNERVRKTASYLVPNIREYSGSEDESYAFSTSWTDYPTDAVSDDSNRGILYNEFGQYYPRDYFYRVTYNKVYTISSFQNIFYKEDDDGIFKNDRYVGIKEIVPSEEEDCSSEIVTPPVNFGKKNFTFTLLISNVLLFLEHLLNLITLTFINSLVRLLFTVGDAADFRPIRKLARRIKLAAFNAQSDGQKRLYLINYPECEECIPDDSFGETPGNGSSSSNFCPVGTLTVTGEYQEVSRTLYPSVVFTASSIGDCSGEDINSLGGITYFVVNQSNYVLTIGNSSYPLSTEFSWDGYQLTFQDDGLLFPEPLSYSATIRSATEKISDDPEITTELESGCQLYDVPYDEDLITYYYIGSGRTKVSPASFVAGSDVTATNLSGDNGITSRYTSTLSSDIIYYANAGVPLVSNWEGESFTKFTPSGQSEFQDGVFTFVPGAQTNTRLFEILREYRRRKRVGKLFCGGIVNFSFIDNWLSGSLYFFQFKGKSSRVFGRRYCGDVVRYVSNQNRFYYRSARYTSEYNWGESLLNSIRIGRPTTMVDLGPRDEFIKEICLDKSLDPNCSVSRSIGPTSFQSFGELLGLAINYRMDVSNNEFDINNFFDNSGFGFTDKVFDGDITQLISINNEAGIEEFDLQNPRYLGYSYQFLDPDDPTFKPIFHDGSNYGPLPVTFYLDDDGERVRACLNEPTHIANDGSTLVQGRLTESSQKVPFFLWDKGGTGFGPYGETSHDNQSWDYSGVQVQPLQGMTYGYSLTSANDDSSDKYLLLPMTYTYSGMTLNTGNVTNDVEFDEVSGTDNHNSFDSEYPGFTYLYVTGGTETSPTAGKLYTRYGTAGTWDEKNWTMNDDFVIRRTQDYYIGNKQILSTPFMFYFGLRLGKTGVDKFIEMFGDKDSFTSAE